MLEITKIKGVGGNEFRDFTLNNPNTLLYVEPRFLSLIENELDAESYWLVARRNKIITGLLPYLVKNGPLGPALNSLPYYGSNGGVIQSDMDLESKSGLISAFYREAKSVKAVSATIITNPLEKDGGFYEANIEYTCKDERIGLITHFPTNKSDLIRNFDDPRPRNIRRAIREGVSVQQGGRELLNFLYETHIENMKAIGGRPKNRRFFEAINNHMESNDWSVFAAYLDGVHVAALLLFYFNKTVEYFTPVLVDEYRNTQALSLIIYEAMQDAISKGFKQWNWGGTWLSQGGVYDFKKRWGTTEYRYYYYTQVYNNRLRECSASYLLDCYPGFFLIPFAELTESN